MAALAVTLEVVNIAGQRLGAPEHRGQRVMIALIELRGVKIED